MANTNPQVDVSPASGPAGLNIHFQGPAGQTASVVNNPADFPSVPAKTGAKSVTANVAGVRFASPS